MADMTQDQLDARRRAEMTHAAPPNGASAAVSRMADALERVGTVPEDVRYSNPLSLMSYLPGLGRPGSMIPGAAYGIPAAVVNAPGNLKKMFMGAMEETGQRVTGQVPPGTPLSADMLGLLMSMPGAGMLMGPKGAVGMSGGRLASAAERLPMDEASRMARAAEGGFDLERPLYRGTVNRREKSAAPSFEAGRGVFTTNNPDVAEIFRYPREWGEVMHDAKPGDLQELYARMKNPLVLDEKTAQRFTDDTAFQSQIMETAANKGHDGIVAPNVREGVGDYTEQGTTVVVMNPNQLRSRFAAFDPAKRDSADLLAAGGVGPVGPMMLQAVPPKSEPLAHPGRGSAMGWY